MPSASALPVSLHLHLASTSAIVLPSLAATLQAEADFVFLYLQHKVTPRRHITTFIYGLPTLLCHFHAARVHIPGHLETSPFVSRLSDRHLDWPSGTWLLSIHPPTNLARTKPTTPCAIQLSSTLTPHAPATHPRPYLPVSVPVDCIQLAWAPHLSCQLAYFIFTICDHQRHRELETDYCCLRRIDFLPIEDASLPEEIDLTLEQ